MSAPQLTSVRENESPRCPLSSTLELVFGLARDVVASDIPYGPVVRQGTAARSAVARGFFRRPTVSMQDSCILPAQCRFALGKPLVPCSKTMSCSCPDKWRLSTVGFKGCMPIRPGARIHRRKASANVSRIIACPIRSGQMVAVRVRCRPPVLESVVRQHTHTCRALSTREQKPHVSQLMS